MATGERENTHQKKHGKTSIDVTDLGWTKIGWVLNQWKARFIALIIFAVIGYLGYLLVTAYLTGSSEDHNTIIKLVCAEALIIYFYVKHIHKHVTLPIKSLDKTKYRFTGIVSTENQISDRLDAIKTKTKKQMEILTEQINIQMNPVDENGELDLQRQLKEMNIENTQLNRENDMLYGRLTECRGR